MVSCRRGSKSRFHGIGNEASEQALDGPAQSKFQSYRVGRNPGTLDLVLGFLLDLFKVYVLRGERIEEIRIQRKVHCQPESLGSGRNRQVGHEANQVSVLVAKIAIRARAVWCASSRMMPQVFFFCNHRGRASAGGVGARTEVLFDQPHQFCTSRRWSAPCPAPASERVIGLVSLELSHPADHTMVCEMQNAESDLVRAPT